MILTFGTKFLEYLAQNGTSIPLFQLVTVVTNENCNVFTIPWTNQYFLMIIIERFTGCKIDTDPLMHLSLRRDRPGAIMGPQKKYRFLPQTNPFSS